MNTPAVRGVVPCGTPLGDSEFEKLMAGLGPFEAAPIVIAAVSGGSDSMALTLLLDRWCRARGGRAVGLTVDHGLRPDSAAEAAQVGTWLRARSIEHHVLPWRGAKPASGIQRAARAARYRLLFGWARDHGVLHLATAHQLEDQAETFLLRLSRGSGLDGLAGMPAVSALQPARLIRPLLPVSRTRLMATLDAVGQSWIEDPSNEDTRYGRVRTRNTLAALARHGLTAERFARVAGNLARLRARLEDGTDAWLARCLLVHPAGFAEIAKGDVRSMPVEVRKRLIGRLSVALGGADYAPRREKIDRLAARLSDPAWRGGTLGGCKYSVKGGLITVGPDLRRSKKAQTRAGTGTERGHKKRDKSLTDGVTSGPVWRPERPLSETKLYSLSSLAGT